LSPHFSASLHQKFGHCQKQFSHLQPLSVPFLIELKIIVPWQHCSGFESRVYEINQYQAEQCHIFSRLERLRLLWLESTGMPRVSKENENESPPYISVPITPLNCTDGTCKKLTI
jgi:hypothetical protein